MSRNYLARFMYRDSNGILQDPLEKIEATSKAAALRAAKSMAASNRWRLVEVFEMRPEHDSWVGK